MCMWKDVRQRYPTLTNLAEMLKVLKWITKYMQRSSQNAESKEPKDKIRRL